MKNNKIQNKFLYNHNDDDETVSYDISNTLFFYNRLIFSK
jgi:hypothetical protein